MVMRYLFLSFILAGLSLACNKEQSPLPQPQKPGEGAPRLIFKFRFDSTQVRLDNIGQPSVIPTGHAAQSPIFNGMSAHYIELAQSANTLLGLGEIVYHAPEVSTGGSNAIDFEQSKVAGQNEEFFSIPLKYVNPGTYEWLRVSLAYQNYDIRYKQGSIEATGTIASFIGFNTYVKSVKIKNGSLNVNANKLQGFWAFETSVFGTTYQSSGQAPPGATTVPNPVFATSPVPQGSCVVTGAMVDANGQNKALVITGKESTDIVVTVSLSVNKSFEYTDLNGDGKFEPAAGDQVVDMGVRGMKPYW
jgi:hypothetical protein